MGERYEAEVGAVAHGGHCIVRVQPDGEERARVVFTRHALPGERVVVEITEGADGDRFWRGDAVEVLAPSPDRVPAPCPVAVPGGCGGCDFQHVALPRQRALKGDVVAEQLRRLAGIEREVEVERVEGDLPAQLAGLRWRTRVRYARLPDGRRAMRRHRSHDLIAVDDCLIAHPEAREPVPGTTVRERVLDRDFAVAGDGFWQVHPGAPRTLVETVLGMLAPQPGESALDLYGGVGLFARFLAEALGPDGAVLSVEGDPRASALAEENLGDLGVRVMQGDVGAVLAAEATRVAPDDAACDLVVLDPPREGARREVVEQVAARSPRAVAYVACDPAALARDLAVFAEHGYGLVELRAFDLFPMTHHVECVALLEPTGA